MTLRYRINPRSYWLPTASLWTGKGGFIFWSRLGHLSVGFSWKPW